MALKLADLQVTNFFTPITSACIAGLANDDGLVVFGFYDSAKNPLPTTASVFAPGCIMLNKSGTSSSTVISVNSATTASPTWTVLNIN